MLAIIGKEKYLANNPVTIKIEGLIDTEIVAVSYSLTRTDDSKVVFQGTVYALSGSTSLDLSDFFACISEPTAYSLTCTGADESDTHEFLVYPGGINNLLRRILHQAGKDIFEIKLANNTANFLLSTRSFSRYIYIPEDELMPLYFYSKGKEFEVRADGELLSGFDYVDATDESLLSLDLDQLRQTLHTNTGALSQVFDIFPAESFTCICTIVITHADALSPYFIKFRNSFGVFEKIRIDNLIDAESEFEYNNITKYDSQLNKFTLSRLDAKMKPTLKASLSAENSQKLLFALDMLLSCEQWLIINGSEYRVLVNVESPIVQTTSGTPTSIALSIRLIDDEAVFSPNDLSLNTHFGIFTDEFNKVFN